MGSFEPPPTIGGVKRGQGQGEGDVESALFFLDNALPLCRCRDGTRAPRRAEDRFLSLLGIYPFECRSCNVRFYAVLVRSD